MPAKFYLPLITGGELRLRPATGMQDLPIIVDADSTLTIATRMRNDQGPAGLVKSGPGTLVLTGNNTHGGNTLVTEGTLVVSGSLASATRILVEPDAVLELEETGTFHLDPARSIWVDGEADLRGTFDINLAAITPSHGADWIIVDPDPGGAVVTYAESFNVEGFSPSGTGTERIWTLAESGWTWTFSQATGMLTVEGGGYAAWAAANNITGGMGDDDNGDGVPNGIKFFLGDASGDFAALPVPDATGTVTWPMGPDYTGAYGTDYVVETSNNLVDWKDAEANDPNLDPDAVSYTLPAGEGKIFVRLKVLGPP